MIQSLTIIWKILEPKKEDVGCLNSQSNASTRDHTIAKDTVNVSFFFWPRVCFPTIGSSPGTSDKLGTAVCVPGPGQMFPLSKKNMEWEKKKNNNNNH